MELENMSAHEVICAMFDMVEVLEKHNDLADYDEDETDEQRAARPALAGRVGDIWDGLDEVKLVLRNLVRASAAPGSFASRFGPR